MMQLTFEAQERDDGTMIVRSPNLRIFSVVVPQGDWKTVFEIAAQYVEANGFEAVWFGGD